MAKKLFVTGAGTDVGKTYVTGLIIKKLVENQIPAAYFKAAMSGNERRRDGSLVPGDALAVKTASSLSQPLKEMCPYIYEAAVSPHLAAKTEGEPVNLRRVLSLFDSVCAKYGYVTAEGSGGIACPLRFDGQKIMLEDFIMARNLPCLVVVDAALGAINSAALTCEYMNNRKIAVIGIILNRFEPQNPMHNDNRSTIEAITGVKVLAAVKPGDKDIDIPLETLKKIYSED